MPGILAIDQATTTGWAWAQPGGEPAWGHVRLNRITPSHNGEIAQTLWASMRELCGRFAPTFIVFETPYVPSPSDGGGRVPINPETMRRLLGLAWEIELFAHMNGIACREISAVSATKHMTGRGRYPDRRAKKRAVMMACQARGWDCQEDEADALALLMFAEMQLYPREALTRPRTYRVPEGPLLSAG